MKNLDEAIAQIRKAFSQVLVKDIYSSPVVTIKQNSPFHVVEHMFRENRIKHLPVVDENNHLAGLITMADLHRIIPPKRDIETGNFYYESTALDKISLKDKMTKNPFTLTPLNFLLDAMEEMARGGYGCIPVVDNDKKILGILTQTDIVKRVAGVLMGKGAKDEAAKIDYSELLKDLQIKMFMSYPPIVLNENQELSEVEQTLRESRIKHLPIVRLDNTLAGVITLSDLYRINAARTEEADGSVRYKSSSLDRYILKYWMTKDPLTLKGDDDLMEAIRHMVDGGFGCIIITSKENKISGLITQSDIIKSVMKMLQ